MLYPMGNREPPTVGEWEIDDRGRRYRKIGNSIEYAPLITTTMGVLTPETLKRINQEKQAKKDEERGN